MDMEINDLFKNKDESLQYFLDRNGLDSRNILFLILLEIMKSNILEEFGSMGNNELNDILQERLELRYNIKPSRDG